MYKVWRYVLGTNVQGTEVLGTSVYGLSTYLVQVGIWNQCVRYEFICTVGT